MSGTDCLRVEAIETIAAGDPPSDSARRHLASCADCRDRLEQALRDARLLEELSRADPVPGPADEVPGHRLIEELHRGSQGAVWRAVHLATNREVAVKVLHRGALATMRQRHRFERETELLAALRHPNVVTVHDAGRTRGGGFFLTMELLRGRTLDRVIADLEAGGESPPRRAAALRDAVRRFAALVSGVAAVHRRGIVHRDLKPQNILVDDAGTPHLLDFGIARAEGAAEPDRMAGTITGEFVGSLACAAPEQVAGDPRLVDVRADVYALGVILYRILTGREALRLSGSLGQVVESIRRDRPAPPSAVNPVVDVEIERVVMQAIAKDPVDRYDSAGALERDLLRYLAGEPVDAMRGGRLYLLRTAIRRHRVAVLVTALVVVTLAVFGATMATLYAKATNANEARRHSLTAVLGILESEELHRRIDEETADRLLSRIEESLRQNLLDQPGDAWIHFRELGQRQLRRGDAAGALRQFETARSMLQAADPGHRAGLADLDHQRGRALWYLQRYEEALAAYEASLEVERELNGEESEGVAASLTHLGATYRALGRLDEAESAQRRALDLRRRLHGADDPRTAASLNNLGVLLRDRARHREALGLFEEALRIARLGGAGTEGLGAALHNLGLEQAALGDLEAAQRSLAESLEVKRRELEDDHPSVASTMAELTRVRVAAAGAVPPARAADPPAPE